VSAQELITIPSPQTALQVFSTEGGIDPLIERVRERVADLPTDISTAKGRAELRANAFLITRTKTALEARGKELAAEQKLIPGRIDACRRRTWAALEAIHDAYRRPLTEWEDAEKARKARHRAEIDRIYALPKDSATADEIAATIDSAEGIIIGADLKEFTAEYAVAKDTALRELRAKLAERLRLDAEEAERARHLQEAQERAAREREDRIRAEAVAAERARAERDAAEERARVERGAAAERHRVEMEVARAEAAARAEREAADRRERELREAAESDRRRAVDAERRAAEAEQRAREEAKAEADRIAAEAKRREDDTRRRAKVEREAVAALVADGIAEDIAKRAFALIARRAVPHVSIAY